MTRLSQLTHWIRPLLLVPLLCMLIGSEQLSGLAGSSCQEDHHEAGAHAEAGHDDTTCGCICHALPHVVLSDHEYDILLCATQSVHRYSQPAFDPLLASIDRPPRQYS